MKIILNIEKELSYTEYLHNQNTGCQHILYPVQCVRKSDKSSVPVQECIITWQAICSTTMVGPKLDVTGGYVQVINYFLV